MQHHVTFQNDSQDHWGGHRRLEIKLAQLRSRTREAPDEPAIRPPAASEVPWAPRMRAAPLPQQGGWSVHSWTSSVAVPAGWEGRGENILGSLHHTTSAATTRLNAAYWEPGHHTLLRESGGHTQRARSDPSWEWARVGGGWQTGPRRCTASGRMVVTVLLMFILCKCPTINIQTS